jgi:uncharacterized protein (TIGR03790 family)
VRSAFIIPVLLAATATQAAPALQPAQLGVVINDDEPNSVELGEYYRLARGIPEANIVHVRIPGKPRKLSVEQFAKLKAEIDDKLRTDVRAVLMVWTAPYAVECNGITAAYALGFDAAQCANTCAAGKASPYFNATGLPGDMEKGMRLAMLLPTESVEEGKALIDRGKASGFRTPAAGAYYLLDASQFIATIEKRQGLKVACPEEIAYRKGYIDAEQLRRLAEPLKKNGYGQYLLQILQDKVIPR